MTDIFFPSDVPVAKVAPRLIDSTGRFVSPLNGAVRSVSRPGSRWGLRLDFQNLYQRDRARLEAFIARMRGAENRALLSPPDYQQRGSFPSAELATNNNFANGTTGYTAGAQASLSVNDRVLRLTRTGVSSSAADYAYQQPSLTQFSPYAWRLAVAGNRNQLPYATFASAVGSFGAQLTDVGLSVASLVPWSGGTQTVYLDNAAAIGSLVGDVHDIAWCSLSQCALVDNQSNLLQQSDSIGSPWSLTLLSVANTTSTAADGTATAAQLNDTTANNTHDAAQAIALTGAANQDYLVCGEFKPGAQPWCFVQLNENAGSTAVFAYVNITTGAVGSIVTGGNWANARAFFEPLANGWYYVALVARCTNAATVGAALFGPASGNGGATYAGTGGAAMYVRRVTAKPSSHPARQTQSAGAPVSPIAQVGSVYSIKGLPVSTQGLLLAGDWVEINKELKRCTAQLDSDAVGRGYLQFSPPIRTSANDNDPVIINMPMGRFLLSAPENGWQTDPGFVSSSSLDFVEAA